MKGSTNFNFFCQQPEKLNPSCGQGGFSAGRILWSTEVDVIFKWCETRLPFSAAILKLPFPSVTALWASPLSISHKLWLFWQRLASKGPGDHRWNWWKTGICFGLWLPQKSFPSKQLVRIIQVQVITKQTYRSFDWPHNSPIYDECQTQ